ncbi:MAG: HprK-related kinase B [Desulfococcaceae bacterium]
MTSATESVQKLVKHIRNRHPAVHGLGLRFGDCRIRVTADSAEVADALRGYFRSFLDRENLPPDIAITAHQTDPPEFAGPFIIKEPDPGKTNIKEEFIDFSDGRAVRKRLTGMVFLFGGREHLAVGPCLKNINQVVNFINNRYIEQVLCRGALLGHAAGVLRNGRGMALAGFSGAGKSTLALQIMAHDAAFVSNDRVMIQPEGKRLNMHGVAKQPRINPGTALNNPALTGILSQEDRDRFGGLAEKNLWAVEHKYDAAIEDCFGSNRFTLRAPMDALIILNWRHGGGDLAVRIVDPNERRDLLSAFIKSTGLFFLPPADCRMPEPSPENYICYLSPCDVIEFSGGIDFGQAARICLAYLETGAV